MSKKLAWGGAGVGQSPGRSEQNLSFQDIMSEDLANHLQISEESPTDISADSTSDEPFINPSINPDTKNDLFIASLLQQDLDREYDEEICQQEKHHNKNSRITVNFDKYKVCPSMYYSDEEDEEEEFDDENRAVDSFEERRRNDPVIPSCGYYRAKNKIVTKHDKDITERRNAERIMNLPPDVHTGDGGGFLMQLNNKVYNELNATMRSKSKNVMKDKIDKATSDLAFDKNTKLILFKWKQNEVLGEIMGKIAVGKESVVLQALGRRNMEDLEEPMKEDEQVPYALKVYKTILSDSDFKTREKYMKEEHRFRNRMSKTNTKKTIKIWAEKEFSNLKKLQSAGIPAPTPHIVKENILIMSLIGSETAAPKLKNCSLSFEDWCIAYEQVIENMTKMYEKCNLVHCDLSEYNILWFDDKCWFIDVGQSVDPKHPSAFIYLYRDCNTVLRFFTCRGVPNLPTPMELFKRISGVDIPNDAEDVEVLVEQEIDKARWKDSKSSGNENFEFLWKESQKERTEE